MRQFRLIASTLGLTVLIWAAADQSLTESREVQVTLELLPGQEPDLHWELLEPASRQAKVKVVGPRTAVDALSRKQPLVARISAEFSALGEQKLNLRERMAGLRSVFEGVTVESTDPEMVVVEVDRIISQSIPVEIDRGNLEFEDSLRVEPEVVEVTIRESHWLKIRDRNPRFTLNIQSVVARSPEGAIEETLALSDTLLGFPVTPQPGSVVVRGKLFRPLETVTLNTVPILFVGTADLLNTFQIIPTEEVITRTVTLRGPKETLDWMQSTEQRFTGFIVLTRSDTENPGTPRSAPPQFRLPPDVKLVEQPPPVEFEIRPFKNSQDDTPVG